MPVQDKFNFQQSSVVGEPGKGVEEPLFWICELRLLSAFALGEKHEIRRISFRKGMNIVWAEPPISDADDDAQRFAGHAGGKTTLCRLIRYVLGETSLASVPVAEAIKHRFPEGWIIAHIRIKGEDWCVARSFMTIRDDVCAKTNCLDEFFSGPLERRGYEEFRLAMESLRPAISQIDRLHNGEELTFWHLLPWFTRDQDSQFRKVFEWRDNTLSHADSPVLIQEQAMLVMRSVIEPEIQHESNLLIKQSQLAQNRKQQVRRIEVMADVLANDEERVHLLSGDKASANARLDELHLLTLKKRYEAEIDLPKITGDIIERLSECQRKRDKLFADYRSQSDQYTQSCQVYEQRKREFLQYEKELGETPVVYPVLDEIQEAAERHPTREYCCVPLEIAKAEGCALTMAYTKSADLESLSNLSKGLSDTEKLTRKRNLLLKYHAILMGIRHRIDSIAKQLQQAEKDLLFHRSQLEESHLNKYRHAVQLLEAIARLEADREKQTQCNRAVKKVEKDQKNNTKELETARKAGRKASGRSFIVYDSIIRYVLGNSVNGTLSLSGGKIEVGCTYHRTDLSSAALNTAKNICFDLMTMTLSIEGSGTHPRFLLHDGPRAADLSANIFRRYFEFAGSLETVANHTPNFQYIITTTEPPPEKFTQEPWLVCKLDGSKPEARLFRCDLA